MKKWSFKLMAVGFAFAFLTTCSNTTESSNSSGTESDSGPVESSNTETNNENKTTVIENLEIASADNPELMKWFLAGEECKKLGDGWRLPTIKELHIMYDNREMIGGFDDYGTYWSSNSDEDVPSFAWALSMHDGKQYSVSKSDYNYSFRMVRDK